MQIQIWIQDESIDNLIKISDELYNGDAEERFNDSVEYTKVLTMEGQVAIFMQMDMYIRLTDNELLTEWTLEY
jgi:hypothetical protein|tara:strand:+ start:527 stop:745 length:219 start_codon:yes stop_codon:yes gene_type:complete